jgi:hypothetical protein
LNPGQGWAPVVPGAGSGWIPIANVSSTWTPIGNS